MVISRIKFPLYGLIIVLSILIGMLYIYFELKKQGKSNKEIFYFYIIYLTFAFLGGKIYTLLVYQSNETLLTVGLSAYGGLIGVIIGAIIFEKIFYCEKNIIKYTVLSLPLVYSLTKIACFISGCCSGIPYNGLFKVIYSDGLNIGQFPIQIVETIIFFIIFLICNKKKSNHNIIFITLMLVFVFKFILDFLRYEHLDIFLSRNQVVSLLLIILIIVVKKFNILNKIY